MNVKKFIDDYRVFPRTFVVIYFYFAIKVFEWFMALETPNEAQAAFAMMIGGGLVYAMKSYSTTGLKKHELDENI